MTANEMADELELLLDRSSSFGSPGYEDFELSSVLTEAQEYYIKKFVDELNNRKLKGFQEIEIRRQGLSGLLKTGANLIVSVDQTDAVLGSDVVGNNLNYTGKFYDLPTDLMYLLYEQVTINKTACGEDEGIVAQVQPVAYHEIQRLFRNKYKRPYYKSWGEALVWRTEYSRVNSGRVPADTKTVKRVYLLFANDFTASNTYTIVYLKNPLAVVVDRDTVANQRNCELDDSTHRVIVDIAKDLMLERVKEQKLQNIESVRDLE